MPKGGFALNTAISFQCYSQGSSIFYHHASFSALRHLHISTEYPSCVLYFHDIFWIYATYFKCYQHLWCFPVVQVSAVRMVRYNDNPTIITLTRLDGHVSMPNVIVPGKKVPSARLARYHNDVTLIKRKLDLLVELPL